MYTELEFKDGTSANCKILGSIEVSGQRYAVFQDNTTSDLYIYGFKHKRKNRYALKAVKDKKLFRAICAQINELIVTSD